MIFMDNKDKNIYKGGVALSDGLRPVVVADMDGTVLRINSWRIFSREVLRELARRGHFAQAAGLIGRQLLKKLGRIEHREVKYAFARAAQGFGEEFYNRLNREIHRHVNWDVMHFINDFEKTGMGKVLASAAAGEYAVRLGRELGFEHVITSPAAGESLEEYIETKGERKVQLIERLAAVKGLRPAVVVTDHWHDLPMLRAFADAKKYLVSPPKRHAARSRPQGLTE